MFLSVPINMMLWRTIEFKCIHLLLNLKSNYKYEKYLGKDMDNLLPV